MEYTPLLTKLIRFIKPHYLGFHTPGHQRGKGLSRKFKKIQKNIFELDLTELPGLDNLKNPTGCIEDSQVLAAKAFGAYKTFFLVNGSTAGIQAALLALNNSFKKIIISRNAHISVWNGFILSGQIPIVAPIEIDKVWGIPLGIQASKLTSFLKDNSDLKALLLTHPTYQGVGCDFSLVYSQLKEKGCTTIVDEAHGSHLFFLKKTNLSAQKNQADIVIHSTHKTLGALTQASMLHVNEKRWVKPIKEALDILQTTSPSYLLLSSLDSVQYEMNKRGHELVCESKEKALGLKEKIRSLQGYRLLEDEIPITWSIDPTKIVISAADLGLTGWELSRILKEKYHILVEQSDYYYVLLLITIGHVQKDLERLFKALKDLKKYRRKKTLSVLKDINTLYEKPVKLFLSPRQVFMGSKKEVLIEEIVGRIAAGSLTIYPPGIPFLLPGQMIEPEHIEFIKWAISRNLPIHGLSKEEKIRVLC